MSTNSCTQYILCEFIGTAFCLLRSIRNDSSTSMTASLSRRSATKAIKGTDVLTGKWGKYRQSRQQNTIAMMWNRPWCKNRRTSQPSSLRPVPNYNEKKSTYATTADPVFASILKGDGYHGKDALRSNSTPWDIDDDQPKSIHREKREEIINKESLNN